MERYDCCQSFINFVSSRINGNLFKYDFKGLLSKVQKCSMNQKIPSSLKKLKMLHISRNPQQIGVNIIKMRVSESENRLADLIDQGLAL